MNAREFFNLGFEKLTGTDSFPWQRRLFQRFIDGDFPGSCAIPTGLGKTSVIPIWLLALAWLKRAPTTGVNIPRRLVYVVNRRTVVDQATNEAMKIRSLLMSGNAGSDSFLADLRQTLLEMAAVPDQECPVGISTLRGQFADNGEWRIDPSRPAIIVGTVDLVGSRLLFSGYRAGFKSWPFFAGLLGQDVLLVHDEAHLEPAFQKLIQGIEAEQRAGGDLRPISVMELTATSRDVDKEPFTLDDEDHQHPVVRKRLYARKKLRIHEIDDEKKLADRVAELALTYPESKQPILIYLNRLEDIQKVRQKLEKEEQGANLCVLTGTMRGYERDRLASKDPGIADLVFARFLPEKDRPPGAVHEGTAFLLASSAGEVGLNASGVNLIVDLVSADREFQRYGRVNRFGDDDSTIELVTPKEIAGDDPISERRRRTLALLRELPPLDDGYDASPAALSKLDPVRKIAAFSPPPDIPAVDGILFDSWSMTTLADQAPGRPPVEDWLHGVPEDDLQRETYVAWREDVALLFDAQLMDDELNELIADYPLKPQELLHDRSYRIADELLSLIDGQKKDVTPVWIIGADGSVVSQTLEELPTDRKRLQQLIAGRTIVLPPRAGGLSKKGLFDGTEGYREDILYDVADTSADDSEKLRYRDIGPIPVSRLTLPDAAKPMRLVRAILLPPKHQEELERSDDEEDFDAEQNPQFRRYFARNRSADDDGSRSAPMSQQLDFHSSRVEEYAAKFAAALGMTPEQVEMFGLAGSRHDYGKDRPAWQRGIGNNAYPSVVLAKSDQPRARLNLGYRHEFGSLLDCLKDDHVLSLSEELKELFLHVVGAHHGRARPIFSSEEAFDLRGNEADAAALALAIPRRFARLQRKYGRWGLAWLESILRAADYVASSESQEVAR